MKTFPEGNNENTEDSEMTIEKTITLYKVSALGKERVYATRAQANATVAALAAFEVEANVESEKRKVQL